MWFSASAFAEPTSVKQFSDELYHLELILDQFFRQVAQKRRGSSAPIAAQAAPANLVWFQLSSGKDNRIQVGLAPGSAGAEAEWMRKAVAAVLEAHPPSSGFVGYAQVYKSISVSAPSLTFLAQASEKDGAPH